MAKKHKHHSLVIGFPRGTNYTRYVHLIYETPDPDNPGADKIRFQIEARFANLNEQIDKTIQALCHRFFESRNSSSVVFSKFADSMVPSSRSVVDYLSKNELDRRLYRVVLDFVGGKDGIDFNLDGDTSFLEGASHLVGVSHAAQLEIHGALGVTDTIIFANLTVDAVFTILHDIALDIYFFHHFFDLFLGKNPSVEALKDFSTCKVLFAKQWGFSFYGKPIADFKNSDNLKYISFAASCRSQLSSESHLDASRYHELWEVFLRAFYNPNLFSGKRSRQIEPAESLVESLVSHICSAPRIGGQLSPRRLKREIRRLILSREARRGQVFFVATTVRPRAGKKRREIASFFRSNVWQKNKWLFMTNPPLNKLKELLPYVQILKLNIP